MTKPVQIQRYRQKGRVLVEDATSALMLYADHLDDKAATSLQVRSLLEAKAKEWVDSAHGRTQRSLGPSYEEHDKGIAHGEKSCADALLSLAATLGNQGK